jgi:predicted transcriptional regulator
MTSEITTIMHFTVFISSEEFDQLAAELEVLTSFLQSDPVAILRIPMEQTARIKSGEINCQSSPITKRVSLTAFINPREGRLPEEFNERQARALMGVDHPLLDHRGKVAVRWALDTMAKELRLELEGFINRIEHIAEVKRRVKEIQRKLDNAAVKVGDTDITIDGNDEGEL